MKRIPLLIAITLSYSCCLPSFAAPAVCDTAKVSLPHLPAITKVAADSPTSAEVMSWDELSKGRFMNQAGVRLNQAKEHQTDAENILRTAKAQLRSQVSNARAFGENDEQLKARIASEQDRYNQLIKPYEDEVSNAQKAVAAAQGLYDACRASYMGLNDTWVPISR